MSVFDSKPFTTLDKYYKCRLILNAVVSVLLAIILIFWRILMPGSFEGDLILQMGTGFLIILGLGCVFNFRVRRNIEKMIKSLRLREIQGEEEDVLFKEAIIYCKD